VRLQTADDASVLSGVMYLPDQPSRAISTGKLTMVMRRNVPYYFARLVGVISGTVNVSASATVQTAGSINLGLVPIRVQYKPGDPTHSTLPSDGTPVSLLFTSPVTPSGTANSWSALALGGSSFTSVSAPLQRKGLTQ
jgi:hypothetical protein